MAMAKTIAETPPMMAMSAERRAANLVDGRGASLSATQTLSKTPET